MGNLLIIHVDYEDFKPETYKGVYVTTYDGQKLFHINTGDFVIDYNIVNDLLRLHYLKKNPNIEVFCSSDVDEYILDKYGIAEISTSKLEQENEDFDLEDDLNDDLEDDLDGYEYDEFEEIEELEKEINFLRQLIADFVSENGLNEQFIDWLQKKNTNGDLDKYIGRFIVLLSEKANSDTIIN
jgi:hypothetical protein